MTRERQELKAEKARGTSPRRDLIFSIADRFMRMLGKDHNLVTPAPAAPLALAVISNPPASRVRPRRIEAAQASRTALPAWVPRQDLCQVSSLSRGMVVARLPANLIAKALTRTSFRDSLEMLRGCDEASLNHILDALGQASPLRDAFERGLKVYR